MTKFVNFNECLTIFPGWKGMVMTDYRCWGEMSVYLDNSGFIAADTSNKIGHDKQPELKGRVTTIYQPTTFDSH